MASDHNGVAARGSDRDRERRICEILADYFEAVEAGRAPDRSEWLARYPGWAEEIAAFLDEQDRLLRLTEPFRPAAGEDRASGPGSAVGGRALPGPDDDLPGTRVRCLGDYELLDEIARGGMGVVFRARQRSLNRTVALKMILAEDLASEADEQRFRREAEAAANLDHPHIVPIFEVGRCDGRSYLSMKLVEGGSLAERLDEFAADPRASARLMALVARAVHHAHQRGVLHRDLKPGNILLGGAPGTPIGRLEPQVTDFGLARRAEDDPGLTQTGAILGTPAYMAPEQAAGQKGAVTVATDVHGLGAALYALLVGRPPFRGDSALETIDRVKNGAVDPPSRHGRPIDRDLETICLECLHKEPERRYGSALAVAEDLERWLRGEPIAARPAGVLERSWRRCRRHGRLIVGSLAGLVAIGLLVFAAWKEVQLRRARSLDELKSREIRRRDREARRARYVADIRLAAQLLGSGQAREAEAVLDRQAPPSCVEDLRDFAWRHLRTLLHRETATLTGHGGEVYHVAFSPDGRTLASAGRDRTARLWDLGRRQARAILAGHRDEVNWVAWSPDGRTLATASDDHSIRLWDAADGRALGEVGRHDRAAVAVLFAPDGRSLISGGRDRRLRCWDVAARREVARWESPVGEVESLAIDRRGQALIIAGHFFCVARFDWATGAVLNLLGISTRSGRELQINGVALSRSGELVAATCDENYAILLDVEGRRRAVLHGHQTAVYSVAFAPDGRTLATACDDGAVRTWDVPSGIPREPFLGHGDRVWCVAFSPDGRTLATASRDGTIKLWDPARRPDRVLLSGFDGGLSTIAFSPDGSRLLAAGPKGIVWSWDVTTARPGRRIPLAVSSAAARVSLSPDGRVLASQTAAGEAIVLYDLPGRRPPIRLEGPGEWYEPRAFSPDGGRFAASCREAILVWDVETGRRLARFGSPGGAISGGALFSPDGQTLIFGNNYHWAQDDHYEDRQWLAAWDVGSGRRLWLRDPAPQPHGLAWSPDGRMLASSLDSRLILLREAADLSEHAILRGHADDIQAAAFSPDSRTLATAGRDRTVRVWDVESGQEQLVLKGHAGPVFGLAFSRDGSTLASLGEALDGSSELILWRTAGPPPAEGAR